MRSTIAVLALLCTGAAQAQPGERETPKPAAAPVLKLPAQVFADVGVPFKFRVETDCPKLRWTFTGITRIPADWLASPKDFAGVCMTGGTYKVDALGFNGDWAEASCLVIVGQQPPAPPGPTPPGPTPPAPPTPVPPGDPLAADLQRVYAANPSPLKATDKAALAGVYRTGAKILAKDTTRITTTGGLFEALRATTAIELSAADALKDVRARLSEEHAKVFPHAPTTALDGPLRETASAYFVRIAQTLDSVK